MVAGRCVDGASSRGGWKRKNNLDFGVRPLFLAPSLWGLQGGSWLLHQPPCRPNVARHAADCSQAQNVRALPPSCCSFLAAWRRGPDRIITVRRRPQRGNAAWMCPCGVAPTACPFHPPGCGLGSRLPQSGMKSQQGPGTGQTAHGRAIATQPGFGICPWGLILQHFPRSPQHPRSLGAAADASAFPAVALTGPGFATFPSLALESRGYTSTLGAFADFPRSAPCDGMSNG